MLCWVVLNYILVGCPWNLTYIKTNIFNAISIEGEVREENIDNKEIYLQLNISTPATSEKDPCKEVVGYRLR